MKIACDELRKRLLYILHLGFVEARNLALIDGAKQQIHDLADALEVLPRYAECCDEEGYELVRFVLQNYQDKYPQNPFNYIARLEDYAAPERY